MTKIVSVKTRWVFSRPRMRYFRPKTRTLGNTEVKIRICLIDR
ncbi:hypothetical protein [Bacteroides sp. UBA939]|nr:hypothetical protein [Bacteroides sp. UBA939]